MDVVADEADRFGNPQASLSGQDEEGVIAPAGPAAAVGGGNECVDFGFGEVDDQRPAEAFRWDREHPRDAGCLFGGAKGSEVEQGVDRGESNVAGSDTLRIRPSSTSERRSRIRLKRTPRDRRPTRAFV